jgi:hypothetical protein
MKVCNVGGNPRSAIGRAFRQLITTFETGSLKKVLKDHGVDDADGIDYNDRMKDGAIFLSVHDEKFEIGERSDF